MQRMFSTMIADSSFYATWKLSREASMNYVELGLFYKHFCSLQTIVAIGVYMPKYSYQCAHFVRCQGQIKAWMISWRCLEVLSVQVSEKWFLREELNKFEWKTPLTESIIFPWPEAGSLIKNQSINK